MVINKQLIMAYRAKREELDMLKSRFQRVLQMIAYQITETDEYSRYLLMNSEGRFRVEEFPDDLAALGISSLDCTRRQSRLHNKVFTNFRASLDDKFFILDTKTFSSMLSTIEGNYDMTKCVVEEVNFQTVEHKGARELKYDMVNYDMYLIFGFHIKLLNPDLLFYIYANKAGEFGIIGNEELLDSWGNLDELFAKKPFIIEYSYNNITMLVDYDQENLVYNLRMDLAGRDKRSLLTWLSALFICVKAKKVKNLTGLKHPHHIFVENKGIDYDNLNIFNVSTPYIADIDAKDRVEGKEYLIDYYKNHGFKELIKQFEVFNLYLHFEGLD